MGGKYIKIGIKSLAAILTAFLLVNGLCFVYFYMPTMLNRSENATWLIFRPNSHTCQFTEGGGVINIDGNGYTNPDKPLKDSGYVLALGTSHTAGEEVKDSERYTSLLNEMLGGGDALNVYNMGMDGHEYPAMVRGFRAATEEFPNSSAVIIEIPKTIYRVSDLEYALNQREFDEGQTSAALFDTFTQLQEIQLKIKENLPFPSFLKNKQFPGGVRPDFSSAFGLNKTDAAEAGVPEMDEEEYFNAVSQTMALMRGQYDGKIIILYHPQATPNNEGGLDFDENPGGVDAFRRACEANGVEFLNMKEAFSRVYAQTQEVPYGFNNTSFGSGHLNRYGHKIVAQELYALLGEGE